MNKKEICHSDWMRRAEHISSKPEWVDRIPHVLWSLGEVFFPIPRGEKGWNYPHHVDEYRYSSTSEILNAYLEQGWNYGVACDNDLIVIDIDEESYIEEIVDDLPATVYQWTGSGTGVHLFYLCEGVTKRRTLSADRQHVGELKADPNGYVVGPGSVHPSGGEYGPLKGDEITRIEKSKVMDALDEYFRREEQEESRDYVEYGKESNHDFYNLTVDDVLPWLEPEKRIAHPIHGSRQTDSNFMKNKNGETAVCWRCEYGPGQGCVVNAQHLLAMKALGRSLGHRACERVRSNWHRDSTLHYHAWMQAMEDGLITWDSPPYTVLKGFLVDQGVIDEDEHVPHRHEAENLIRYHITLKEQQEGEG